MASLRLYSGLDDFFDTRRGIITKIAREHNPNFQWSDFEEVYKGRRMDTYNRPSLGITPEKFEERFAKRSIDDWADENECFFYPSNLVTEIIQIVRGMEFGAHETIHVSKISLSLNCYPFVLSDELAAELVSVVEGSFKLPIDVRLVNVEYEKQTAIYLNGYDYVFRYGHLLRPEYKAWFETIAQAPRAGTKYIVPELLVKDFADTTDTKFLNDIPIGDHIRKCSAVLGGVAIFVPVDKKLFDYQEVEKTE